MKLTIQCRYSCSDCGIVRAVVTVPARDDESVTEWMDKTIPLLVADHENRSPHCHPRAFSEVLIPVQDNSPVGGPIDAVAPKPV